MSSKKIKLGEVATFINGYPFEPNDWSSEGLEIIRIQNLTKSNSSSSNYYKGVLPEKYRVKNGDILISWSATLDIFEWTGNDAWLNQHIFKVQFDKIDIDKVFFKYAIVNLIDSLRNQVHGATMKHITKGKFDATEVNVPPLATQKRIAEILDKADALRKKDRQLLKHYDALAQSLFVDMFGDPVKNEKGWEVNKLGSHISALSDYHANGSYEVLRDKVKLTNLPDYALMIRTTDLENNNFSEGVNYISEDAYNFLSKSTIYGGEIIMNKIGSAGNIYLMPYLNRPVSLGMNAFLVRFNSLNNIYVYYFLSTGYGKRQIKKRVFGAVTKTITKDAVRDIPIICPPIPLQNQFAEQIQNIEQQKQKIKAQIQQSENLFQSLLQKAFNGGLD